MRKSNRREEELCQSQVDDGRGAKRWRQAWYLSNDLSSGDFERYYFSTEWVFPGWIGFSGRFRREFPVYPPTKMLVDLAKMSQTEREEHAWFRVYLWEKKRRKAY